MKNHNNSKKDDKSEQKQQPRNRYDNGVSGSQSSHGAIPYTSLENIKREHDVKSKHPQSSYSNNQAVSNQAFSSSMTGSLENSIHNQQTAGVDHFHVDSGTQGAAYSSDPDADMKIYPDGLNNLEVSSELPIAPFVAMSYPFGATMGAAPIFGAFATQAITDNTNQFEDGKAPKPSDQDVEEGRDWIQENKK